MDKTNSTLQDKTQKEEEEDPNSHQVIRNWNCVMWINDFQVSNNLVPAVPKANYSNC